MSRLVERRLAACCVAIAVTVSLLLGGCSLLPAGGPTDYAGLAKRLTDQVGSTEVTSWAVRDTQVNLTIRADNADTNWSVGTNSDPLRIVDYTDTPASTVSADSIDWQAMADALAAIPSDCNDAWVSVRVLPAGQFYQQSFCGLDLTTRATVNGQAIPDHIVGQDEAAFQQFTDLIEPLLPTPEVYALGTLLDGQIGGLHIEGMPWTLANGESTYLEISYANELMNGPLVVQSNDHPSYSALPVDHEGPPAFSFRLSDYPAAAYANAITEGAAQVTGNIAADGIDFSAISTTELAWTMTAGPVERVYGTINR